MRMARNTFYLIICTLLLLTISCTNGDFSELLRSYDDPFDETTAADCYTQSCTVKLSWSSDECADTFILMRAVDDGTENFRQIYSGTGTSYSDEFYLPDDQKRFIYRLDKTRGNRRFNGSECVCAVVSATLHDTHEPNNTIEKAIELERIINATMPCSQFNYKGKSFGDEDWYYIRLKPLCTASILFIQAGNNNSVPECDFMYMEQGGEIKPLWHNDKFTVSNTSLVSRNIYFKIMPDMTKLFSGSAGTAVPAYTLQVTEESFK